jgi:SNF2 family DNA or RNA helicase
MDPLARYRAARAVQAAAGVTGWPELSWWNSSPCAAHSACERTCRDCGVILSAHQKTGALWLYLAGQGMLADSYGTGKTFQIAALLAFCLESGEIPGDGRAVVIARSAAAGQWHDQLRRAVPSLRVIVADGTLAPARRRALYGSDWDVAVITPGTLAPARGKKISRGGDVEILETFPLVLVVADDTDGMRSHSNRTAYAVKRLCNAAPRRVMVHATSLQKRLTELHSFLEPVGGTVVFGTPGLFRRRFVATETAWFTTRDRFGHAVSRTRLKETGVKPGMLPELHRLMAPMVLRRTAADIRDASLPAIVHDVVWLDPSPAQRRRYDELREGVLRVLREQGEEITRPQAGALWTHGWQICSGLATMGTDDSVKLDWVMDAVTGDLSEEKVVVFINFRPNVAALAARLAAGGIASVTLWGDERSRQLRDARLHAFRTDPACRVLVGTTTIEASIDLQVSRHLIACDTISNPLRMGQIAGRVRRDGSRWSTVYFHQLLLRNTQEAHIPGTLISDQALADQVWDETSDLFARAAPADLLRMIAA